MDAARALEWVLLRCAFVERRADRRRRDGLPDWRERQEIEAHRFVVAKLGEVDPAARAAAEERAAAVVRGRTATRSPETLIESLCRILRCQPHEALARVEALVRDAKEVEP